MSVLRYFGRKRAAAVSVLAMTIFLGSCDLAKNQLQYDRSAELDRQDYRDMLSPQQAPQEEMAAIPDFQPVLSTPEELRLPSPLVTVSVNQTVSLRDLMFELADQAGVDLELDPQIRGSIIFTAKERPFDEVIDRICEMSGLRYKFKGNVLRVELDRPFIKTYSVDYIGGQRTGSSEASAEVTLGGSGGGGGETAGGSTSGGSSAEVSSESDGDAWKELQENVEQILTASDTHISLATLADPVAMPVNTMPPPAPVDPNNPNATPAPGQAGQMPAAVPPALNVSTVAGEPLVPNPPATFSISKQSGTITVFASERQQKQISEFLNDFRRRLTTQILIEARVLQVDLNDEFATGVDWAAMNLTGLASFDIDMPSIGLTPAATGSFTGIFQPGSDLNLAIQAISRFGTVRALSSPRIMTLNNQPALVNVSESTVYFDFEVEPGTTDSNGVTTPPTIDSEIQSVPEGVILSVTPSANPDTGEILLTIRPTVSKITSTIPDPTIPLVLALNNQPAIAINNNIPQLSIQEMDSLLRLQSGQTVVMGGLMKDSNTNSQDSVPVIGDLPMIGTLFRNHSDKVEKSELVIFLTARLVPGTNVDDMDRKLYNKFSLDRRPTRL